MAADPKVVFRVEPSKPDLQQALRNVEYGTAMQEVDIATVRLALQNILDLFIPALQGTLPNGSTFLRCFKNKANWLAVLSILKRCEAIIKYCLGHDGMQHVQKSLSTLRFVKGGRPRVGKKGCGILGAQAEKTIWLYEAWWKAPSLRSASGVKPEQGHGARVVDALADAFMQTQEGTLLHEIVHLASIGQMVRLLSPAYPRSRLPSSLWGGQDWVGDTAFHEHVNARIFCESIIDAKYRQPKKGGGLECEAAYHFNGVEDLASIENGDIASVLNADSYNAFAALALMDHLKANLQNYSRADVGIPILHPDATNRLRQAISKSVNVTSGEPRRGETLEDRKVPVQYNHLEPVAGRNWNGCFSDLSSWPTPADTAITYLARSDAGQGFCFA